MAGGDYTRGLANVGPVTALELITEFVSGDQDPAKNKNNCEDKNEAFSEVFFNFFNFIILFIFKALQGLQRMRDILLFPPSEKESSKRLLIRKAVMSANSQEQIKMVRILASKKLKF